MFNVIFKLLIYVLLMKTRHVNFLKIYFQTINSTFEINYLEDVKRNLTLFKIKRIKK